MIDYARNEKGLVVAIECVDCDGRGEISVLDCGMPSSACCGGCYKELQCLICNGNGEIDLDLEDEYILDLCMMIKSVDYRIHGFNDLLTWYRDKPGADLEDLKRQINNLQDRKNKFLKDIWEYILHARQVEIEFNEEWGI